MRARGADGLPVLQAAHVVPHHLFVSERRPAVALALGYGKDKEIILIVDHCYDNDQGKLGKMTVLLVEYFSAISSITA